MIRSLILAASALAVDMNPADFRPIVFDGIPATLYERSGEELKMTVNKSSSFILRPFDKPRSVSGVTFAWRSEGELKMKDVATERTKAGDDTRLRICLLISGEEPLIPFFAPAWVKAIRDAMKLPADKLHCLVAGSLAKPGETWPSPYDDSIELEAVGSTIDGKGWHRVDAKLARPIDVVGLWIMADGDDTGSEFTTWLKDLVLR
jgi:hypothetical protein